MVPWKGVGALVPWGLWEGVTKAGGNLPTTRWAASGHRYFGNKVDIKQFPPIFTDITYMYVIRNYRNVISYEIPYLCPETVSFFKAVEKINCALKWFMLDMIGNKWVAWCKKGPKKLFKAPYGRRKSFPSRKQKFVEKFPALHCFCCHAKAIQATTHKNQ